MNIMNLILMSFFIEAVVSAIKPLWVVEGERMTPTEGVSILLGVALAVICKLDMVSVFVPMPVADWAYILFYVITGVALGRGPSFVFDLWKSIKSMKDITDMEGEINEILKADAQATEDEDLDVSLWKLDKLKRFCAVNGVPCEGCETEADYRAAIDRVTVIRQA